MPTVADSHISTFQALHILSRGTDLTPLAYLPAFERWMRTACGYACEWIPGRGRYFVRETADGREVLEGHLTDLPLKDYLRSFLEVWPQGQSHDEVLSIMGRQGVCPPHLLELPVQMLLTGTGVRDVCLISLAQCEVRLLNDLRAGAIRAMGLPNLVVEDPLRDYVAIPPTAFMGTPLLDWIAGDLGRHDRRCSGGRHFYPDPPGYTGLQFEREAVHALRAQLVEEKRQAFLSQYDDPRVREAMKVVWLASEEPSVRVPGAHSREEIDPYREEVPLPLPPKAKSVENTEYTRQAEGLFCKIFACNRKAVAERTTFEDAYKHICALLKEIYPDKRLPKNRFRTQIWAVHAPHEWSKGGRFPEKINL